MRILWCAVFAVAGPGSRPNGACENREITYEGRRREVRGFGQCSPMSLLPRPVLPFSVVPFGMAVIPLLVTGHAAVIVFNGGANRRAIQRCSRSHLRGF